MGAVAQPSSISRSDTPRVAFDPGYPHFYEDRVFQAQVAAPYRGTLAWTRFGEVARGRGFEIHTADLFARGEFDPRGALLVSHTWSNLSAELVERGAVPAVLFCLEVPVIAWAFYRSLPRVSGRYRHAFLYAGARHLVRSERTRFYPLYWPMEWRAVRPSATPWAERKFAVLINAKKTLAPASLFGLLRSAIDRVSPFVSARERPSLRRYLAVFADRDLGRELYSERLRAVGYFSQRSDFTLYGYGWGDGRGLPSAARRAVRRSYAGEVPDKQATLAEHRFAICFENCVYPGCVTEKIFDCLLAGCIPVYLGAPDIQELVPPEAFVDFRAFGSYEELERYLHSLTPDEAEKKLRAAREFLASPAFERFHQETFAHALVDAIESVHAERARERRGGSAASPTEGGAG